MIGRLERELSLPPLTMLVLMLRKGLSLVSQIATLSQLSRLMSHLDGNTSQERKYMVTATLLK